MKLIYKGIHFKRIPYIIPMIIAIPILIALFPFWLLYEKLENAYYRYHWWVIEHVD